MAFITDSVRAQNAFNSALDQAKYTTRDLFASFGLSKQNPSTGQWSTSVAGEEFAPGNIVNFNEQTGVASINQAALDQASAGEFGTAFGYNRMSETMGTAAAREAAATAALRGRGIMGGGLARQAQAASEGMQAQEQAGIISELLGGLGQTYAGTSQQFGDWMTSRINEAGTTAQTVAGTNAENPYAAPAATPAATPAAGGYTKLGTPGGPNVPKNPRGGKLYTDPRQVTWQYRINGPQGKGWYRK
jgi:hypothetical protein